MTDSTAARRALLRILLDRVDRDALLPAEVPLLRACVAAEEHAADTATFVTIQARADQATIARVRELAESATRYDDVPQDRLARHILTALDGASDGNPTPDDTPSPRSRRYYRGTDEADMHAEYMRMLTAVTRVRAEADHWRSNSQAWGPYAAARIEAALDGPSPTPADTPPTPRYGGPLCHDTDPTTLKECALKEAHPGDHADANVTWPRQPDTPSTPVDEDDEDDEQVACWHIEPDTTCDWNICRQPERLAAGDPGTDPANGLATPNLDALRAGQPVWRGPIEGYGTGQITGILAHLADCEAHTVKQWGPGDPPNPPLGEGVQRCSPLVNVDCPGHLAPPYCEPAASNPVTVATPPSWADAARCAAQYHGTPGETWQCQLDADHVGDHREPREPNDGPRHWTDETAVYPLADAPSEPADCWRCKHPAHAPGECSERDGAEPCRCSVGDAPSEQQ